jgi:Lipoprotein LpqB beta-propeller domain/Sporulation and spore germination
MLAAAALAVLLLSACATVPDSGPVQQGKVSAAGAQYLLQPVTQGPQLNWTPTQVVSGFIEALSSFAHGYAAARPYLTPSAQGKWETQQQGWAAEVTGQLALTENVVNPRLQGASPGLSMDVDSSGQQLATVTPEGQYQSSQGQATYTYTFQLVKLNGQWRIGNPPSPPPLNMSDFQRVYLSRDLFYLAPSGILPVGQALVPSPIFVPLQATTVEVADTLVNSLLNNPQGWLLGAAVSALADTRLLGKVTVNAGTAVVDLGGQIPATAISQILAQLVWTLASPSYGQPSIAQSVELEINGRAQTPATWSGGQPQQGGRQLLADIQAPSHQPLYSLAGRDEVETLSSSAPAIRTPVHAGNDRDPLASIAVSPAGRYVAGITQSGRAVYYGLLSSGSRLTAWATGGPFTSVSWDSNGNLWIVGRGGVWMIHPGQADIPLTTGIPAGSSVVQLQVAPDGVRVALVVHGPNGNQLMLAAIAYLGGPSLITTASLTTPLTIGSDISPTQLTWYDSDSLIVLSPSPAGTVLNQVPVNGGSSTTFVAAPGTQSISAAGPANPLAAGLPHGGLTLADGLNAAWGARTNAGASPTYAAPTPATP